MSLKDQLFWEAFSTYAASVDVPSLPDFRLGYVCGCASTIEEAKRKKENDDG